MSRSGREPLSSSSRGERGGFTWIPWRGDLAMLAVVVLMTGQSNGQDVSSKGDGPTSASRSLPDALKFAHGLLRQRKFDLAAEEYDRFLAPARRVRTGSTHSSGLAMPGSTRGDMQTPGGPSRRS